MGEKFIHVEKLADGSERKLHVDFEANKVYIENGTHPETGEVLLRHSSDNAAPFAFLKTLKAEPTDVEVVEPTEPEPALTTMLDSPGLEHSAFLGDVEALEEPKFEADPSEDEVDVREEDRE